MARKNSGSEVAASIDMMAALGGGGLPEKEIDGRDIWPLMSGEKGAETPHENYVFMHGPGTVRSSTWKLYLWQEGKGKHEPDIPISRRRKTAPGRL